MIHTLSDEMVTSLDVLALVMKREILTQCDG
jgi:hypothetical protein